MLDLKPALKISLIYFLTGIFWIILSDNLTEWYSALFPGHFEGLFQTVKGIFYVLATALLLYSLVKTFEEELSGKVKQLEKNQQDLFSIQHITKTGLWEYQLSDESTTWSSITREIFETTEGYKPSFMDFCNFCDDEVTRTNLENSFSMALQRGIHFDHELIINSINGKKKWIRISGNSEMENNLPVRIFGIVQDISQLRQNILQIKQNEYRFRNILQNIAEGHIIRKLSGELIEINESGKRILEMSLDHLPAHEQEDARRNYLINNEKSIQAISEEVLKYGSIRNKKVEITLQGQRSIILNINSDLIQTTDGELQVATTFTDVTSDYNTDRLVQFTLKLYENFHTQDEKVFIQESVELIRQLLSSEFAAFYILNTTSGELKESVSVTGKVLPATDTNPVFNFEQPHHKYINHILSLRNPVVCNDQIDTLYHHARPKNNGEIQRILEIPVLDAGILEAVLVTANKRTRYSELDTRQLQAIAAVFWTALQRKRHLTELNHQKELLEEAQRIARIGSWEINHKTNNLTFSHEAFRIFGYDEKQSEPDFSSSFERIHPDDRQFVADTLQVSLKSKMPYFCTHRIIKDNGEICYIEERGKHYYDEKGNPIRTVGTCLDVTREQRYQKNINEQNEKLRDIAWVQSHVIRAPIARILGLLDTYHILTSSDLTDEEVRKLIKESAMELDQIVHLLTSKTKPVPEKSS